MSKCNSCKITSIRITIQFNGKWWRRGEDETIRKALKKMKEKRNDCPKEIKLIDELMEIQLLPLLSKK